MIGRRAAIGLSLLCALLFSAFAAQGAFAAGQTAYECVKVSSGSGPFEDAHCDFGKTTVGGYEHKVVPLNTSTEVTVANGKTKNNTTEAVVGELIAHSLKGFANVKVTCTTVTGTGTFENKEEPIGSNNMRAKGTAEIKFSNGAGICDSNQVGCKNSEGGGVKVGEVTIEAETVEPASTEYINTKEREGAKKAEKIPAGMGLYIEPDAPSTKFTTLTFEGTCGLKVFGAMPVTGSVIGTASNEPLGTGATVWFNEEMSQNLRVATVGEITLNGAVTLSNTATKSALVATTSAGC